MVDAIHRSRRFEAPEESPELSSPQPSARSATAAKASAPELEHPIHYPPELFSGSTFAKTPGVFAKPGAPARDLSAEHALRERGEPAAAAAIGLKHASGTPYTTSPTELGVQTTKMPASELVSLFRAQWPELSEEGARVLVAQSFGETANGAACFNFNFGNIKAFDTKSGHQYLGGTWEIAHNAAEEKWWISQGGVPADDKFKSDKGFPGANIFVIHPPAPSTRFRAFSSPQEGASFFVGFHQKLAAQHPDYLAALNHGDTKTVAHYLALHHYATADETAYAASMANHKKAIDVSLGSSS